jgi:D-alanyl-lipoteichoic acid acyltransferase DltB (MBOAT superfamily)
LAVAVNRVYGNVEEMSGLTLLIATGFFAYQIYCDFSGYSDIAIGSAKILGIDLMENFKRPYFSTSIKEFWSRWHISLSTWFRDYVYIPLGGSKKGSVRTYVNVSIVFLISGLWHGASWMFVIWGAIHGLYQLYEKATYNIRAQLWKYSRLDGTWIHWGVKWFVTMGVVLLSWVFFRSNNLTDAVYILEVIISDVLSLDILSQLNNSISERTLNIGFGPLELFIVISSILFLETFQFIDEKYGLNYFDFMNRNKVVRWAKYYFIVLIIMYFGYFNQIEFLYFQF